MAKKRGDNNVMSSGYTEPTLDELLEIFQELTVEEIDAIIEQLNIIKQFKQVFGSEESSALHDDEEEFLGEDQLDDYMDSGELVDDEYVLEGKGIDLLFDKNKPNDTYVLTVTLDNSPVKVRRRLEVPANLRLECLAQLLVAAMGWGDSHLYQFRVKNIYYVTQREIENASQWGFPFGESHKAIAFTVWDVLKDKNKTIKFEYDYGDGWEHTVKLTNIKPATQEPQIRLMAVAGACPPDDCGGAWGYADMLRTLNSTDKKDKRERKELIEWLKWCGYDNFDPEAVDMTDLKLGIDDCIKDLISQLEELAKAQTQKEKTKVTSKGKKQKGKGKKK